MTRDVRGDTFKNLIKVRQRSVGVRCDYTAPLIISLIPRMLRVSQVTCGDHVKWITNKKSKKDRSVSKGETMSLERDSDLKRTVRIGDSRHRCKEKQQRSKGLESRRWRYTT